MHTYTFSRALYYFFTYNYILEYKKKGLIYMAIKKIP